MVNGNINRHNSPTPTPLGAAGEQHTQHPERRRSVLTSASTSDWLQRCNSQLLLTMVKFGPTLCCNAREYLNYMFPNRWIGRRGQIEWPARVPHLLPCDYFVWSHLKTMCAKPNLKVLVISRGNQCRWPKYPHRNPFSSQVHCFTQDQQHVARQSEESGQNIYYTNQVSRSIRYVNILIIS